jgi:hypothetical protein
MLFYRLVQQAVAVEPLAQAKEALAKLKAGRIHGAGILVL